MAPDQFRLLARYGANQWRLLLVIACLMIATAAAAALQPLPMKVLVDYGLAGLPSPAWLPRLSPANVIAVAAVLSVVTYTFRTLLDSATKWVWAVVGQRMVFALASDLFRHLVRLSPLYHSRTTVGDSISRLTGDTWAIYTFVAMFMMGPIHQILTVVSVAMVAFALDPTLA